MSRTLKRVRVRVVRRHRHDCAARARRNRWASPWWLDGSVEYRTQTGRAARRGASQSWLVARCIFGAHYGKPFKGACPALAVVHAMDVSDALTNLQQLSTEPKIRTRKS